MRFNTPEEVKLAADKMAKDLYQRHVENGNDMNPYCTDCARNDFDRGYKNEFPKFGIGVDYDYRWQLGRAIALLVENERRAKS